MSHSLSQSWGCWAFPSSKAHNPKPKGSQVPIWGTLTQTIVVRPIIESLPSTMRAFRNFWGKDLRLPDASAQAVPLKSLPCHRYSQGFCAKGRFCRFSHDKEGVQLRLQEMHWSRHVGALGFATPCNPLSQTVWSSDVISARAHRPVITTKPSCPSTSPVCPVARREGFNGLCLCVCLAWTAERRFVAMLRC